MKFYMNHVSFRESVITSWLLMHAYAEDSQKTIKEIFEVSVESRHLNL